MAQSQSKSIRIFSIIIAVVFFGSLVAAFVSPFMQKDQLSKEEQAQKQLQEQIQKYQDELNKQQEQIKKDQEVDPNFKVEGPINQMQIIDLTTGTGDEAKLGDTIKVKYKGALASDGSVFDSNSDGVEFQLKVGSLIQGWTEGIPGMKVGGKRRLVVPAAKGYGAQGSGASIPPNADLVFEVELLSVKR
jgi:FKBP-type peptidyl-prolyl cis-trans isomerase